MSYMTGNFPVMADGKIVGKVTISQNGQMFVFDCVCRYNSKDILRLAAVCDGRYVPLGVIIPDGGRPDTGILHLKKSFTKNALSMSGYVDPTAFHLIRPNDIYTEPPAGEPSMLQTGGLDEPSADRASEPIIYNDFPDPTEYVYDYSDDEDAQEDRAAPADFPEKKPADGWTAISNPGTLFDDEGIREACGDVASAFMTEKDGYILLAVPVLPSEPFPLMPVFCFGSSGEVGGQECIIFKIRNGNLTL